MSEHSTDVSMNRAQVPLPLKKWRVTLWDTVGLASSGLAFLSSLVMVTKVQPMYAKLFADFGLPLPLLTRVFLQPWLAIGLAAPPLALVLYGIWRGLTDGARAILMVGAVLLTLVPIAFF